MDLDSKHAEACKLNESTNDDNEKKVARTVLWRQIFANVGPLLLMTGNGTITGYSAILLPQLNETDSTIKVTRSQESWIASLAPLQMAFGCLIGGYMLEIFGRKTSLLLSALIAAVGWGFIILTSNVTHLLIGRFITGLSVGMASLFISCFIGEVSHPNYRGLFLGGIALGIALGTLLAHIFGIMLSWKATAAVLLCFPVISLVFMLIVPESHIWYVNKEEAEKARRSYLWFRGDTAKSLEEIDDIIELKAQNGIETSFKTQLQACLKPRFLKPLGITCIFFILSQVTGNNAVVFYSVTIMQMTVSSLDKHTAMLIIDLTRTIMAVIACVLTRKYKVRPLALISGIGTFSSLFLLSTFIHVSSNNPENAFLGFLPLATFFSYTIFVSIGIIPLPWSLCGEIFPPAMKGAGGGLSSTINFLAFFVVVKTNPDMFYSIGFPGTFAIYGIATFIGTLLLYFILPETRGKSLEEIQGFFNSKK